jgi:hypothetical protein
LTIIKGHPFSGWSFIVPGFYLGTIKGRVSLPSLVGYSRVNSRINPTFDKGGDSFNFLATFLGKIALRVPAWNTVGVKG